MMMGSRNINFNYRKNFRLGFINDENNLLKKGSYMYFEGIAKHVSLIGGINSSLTVYEIDSLEDEKTYNNELSNPLEDYNHEKAIQYGSVFLWKPDEKIKQKLVEIQLHLKSKDFEKVKFIVDKFFYPKSTKFGVSLSVVGMKLGLAIDDDEIPEKKYLPIIGYHFELAIDQDTE